MSLTLYGSSVPEPTPEEPLPNTRRRYLIIFATVIALILGGGSAAFLLLNSSPNINQTAPNAYQPPDNGATATDTVGDDPSPSADPSASPSASPSHSPSPSRSPSVRPSPGPVAATYHAPNGVLCPSVDFQPVVSMGAGPTGTPYDDHTDKSNYVDYTCHGTFGKVVAQVDGFIFTDPGAAAASYADIKSFAPANSDRFSIGTDAYGFVTNTSGYTLWVLSGNLTLKVYLGAAGGVPTAASLRDAAVKMAPNTMRNLAVKV